MVCFFCTLNWHDQIGQRYGAKITSRGTPTLANCFGKQDIELRDSAVSPTQFPATGTFIGPYCNWEHSKKLYTSARQYRACDRKNLIWKVDRQGSPTLMRVISSTDHMVSIEFWSANHLSKVVLINTLTLSYDQCVHFLGRLVVMLAKNGDNSTACLCIAGVFSVKGKPAEPAAELLSFRGDRLPRCVLIFHWCRRFHCSGGRVGFSQRLLPWHSSCAQ